MSSQRRARRTDFTDRSEYRPSAAHFERYVQTVRLPSDIAPVMVLVYVERVVTTSPGGPEARVSVWNEEELHAVEVLPTVELPLNSITDQTAYSPLAQVIA